MTIHPKIESLCKVQEMIERGVPIDEIAATLGLNRKTIRSYSYQIGAEHVRFTLPAEIIAEICREADNRHIAKTTLMSKILATVAKDHLFDAVLDGD